MNKCKTCLNSRFIISENGFHSVCCLSSKKAMDCIMNRKNAYMLKTITSKENKDE